MPAPLGPDKPVERTDRDVQGQAVDGHLVSEALNRPRIDMAADGFAGTTGVGAGAAGAFGVGSKPTDDWDVSIVIGSSIPGAHYGQCLPPPRGKSGETGASRGVSRQGRIQGPFMYDRLPFGLGEMAWKEIGT